MEGRCRRGTAGERKALQQVRFPVGDAMTKWILPSTLARRLVRLRFAGCVMCYLILLNCMAWDREPCSETNGTGLVWPPSSERQMCMISPARFAIPKHGV